MLYEKEKKWIDNFVLMDSKKEEKKSVKPKSKDKKGKRIKRVANSALKQKSSKKQKMMQEKESSKSDEEESTDYEQENKELRMWLAVVSYKEETVDPEILSTKTKDETNDILKKFITEIENLKDLKVKITRCDNGGEFRNKEMNDFCLQKGIKREFSNARTPQQNGVAERRNRTLIEAARTMVLVNKSQNKTPYELFNGRTPAIGFLKPFGCHVMILNTLDNLGKFEPKEDKGYFIGYSMSSKAFRVFNKRNRRVEENLHVEFLENKAIEKGAGPNCLFDIDSLTKSINYMPVDAESSSSKPNDESNTKVPEGTEAIRVEADVSNMEITISASPNPTLKIHKDHPKSQIIGPVDTPIQTRHKSKEVLKNKKDERGIVVRNKARLVAQGHTQEEGIDYDEVFAPVARIKAIRLFLAYTSFMGFTVYQMDVKSAFLYGTIDKEVYVMQPPGFQDPAFPAKVYKVEKAMYGLHQAPRAWYGTLSKYLLKNGFQREPKKVFDALQDPSWVDAIPIRTKWVLKNKKDEKGIVPPGFHNPVYPAKVYKVEKAMYGLHQAPRAWYGTLSKYLLKNSFQRGTIDQTLFIRRKREDFILAQVYVDDIIFGSSNPQLCRE
nr:hypothetical protein [Tanacetum cinerariifolium]